ncbi:putative quinol monooxygenase [Vogesella sp. LIG4]|uniref:putative quinol monooxygenase n=1 Tax=Vogesella sp. LIG4 TaxID=1192162 RepID=UPI00081F948A|nr:antibiotic biosynthesis monooxygenase family protein [Vogesella sp. LIG4]SCK17237.1 Quinol monooxygenase YgiN [Vogesella sp. LIG4]
MSHEVVLIVLIQVQPGLGKQQIQAFEKLAPLVRAEAGCLEYELHRVANNNDQFVLTERWTSAEALSAHDVSPHMLEADRLNPTFRAGPATVLQLTSYR